MPLNPDTLGNITHTPPRLECRGFHLFCLQVCLESAICVIWESRAFHSFLSVSLEYNPSSERVNWKPWHPFRTVVGHYREPYTVRPPNVLPGPHPSLRPPPSLSSTCWLLWIYESRFCFIDYQQVVYALYGCHQQAAIVVVLVAGCNSRQVLCQGVSKLLITAAGPPGGAPRAWTLRASIGIAISQVAVAFEEEFKVQAIQCCLL